MTTDQDRAAPVITVVLIDDSAVTRLGVAALLAAQSDISVVGEARDGIDGLNLVAAQKPDVVVVDLKMPGLSGVDVTRLMCERHPSVRVLILTSYEGE